MRGREDSDKLFILKCVIDNLSDKDVTPLLHYPILACQGNDGLFYFRKRFSKAWRASSGLEEEVSRSMVVRGE